MDRDQPQSIYLHGLSHFGPCLGKMPHDLNSVLKAKDHDFGLRYIDVKNVQNSCSLFKSLHEPTLDLESITTPSTSRTIATVLLNKHG